MERTFGAPRALFGLALIALLLIGSTCGSGPADQPADGDPPKNGNGGDNGAQVAPRPAGGSGSGSGSSPAAGSGSGGTVEVRTTDDPKLYIGTYTLRKDGVVDGDTFKVDGLNKSLRLLCIDTEETPKPGRTKPAMLALMRNDFAKYARRMRGDAKLPVKYATPLGVEATEWAKELLGPAAQLRLERDEASQGPDRYGRTLCHAWLIRKGKAPLLYTLECVRQGMSPYFDKYGRSARFHGAFVAAQNEARAAKRGIWDPKKSHYPDYAERIIWWNRRGEALARFNALGNKAPLMLGSKDAISTLSRKIGREVWVIGILDDHDGSAVKVRADGATLRLGGRRYIEIELAGADVVKAIAPEKHFGLLIAVRGKVDREGSKMKRINQRYMRIKVTDVKQVTPGDRLPVE